VVILWVLLAVAALIVTVVAWRVVVHDRTIRRIRFGVFYERDHNQERTPDDRDH